MGESPEASRCRNRYNAEFKRNQKTDNSAVGKDFNDLSHRSNVNNKSSGTCAGQGMIHAIHFQDGGQEGTPWRLPTSPRFPDTG